MLPKLIDKCCRNKRTKPPNTDDNSTAVGYQPVTADVKVEKPEVLLTAPDTTRRRFGPRLPPRAASAPASPPRWWRGRQSRRACATSATDHTSHAFLLVPSPASQVVRHSEAIRLQSRIASLLAATNSGAVTNLLSPGVQCLCEDEVVAALHRLQQHGAHSSLGRECHGCTQNGEGLADASRRG